MTRRKWLPGALVALVIALACLALGLIWHDESALPRRHASPVPVSLVGTYAVSGADEAPLPDDGWLDVSGRAQVTINGRFSADIPAGQKLLMRIDNLRVRLYQNGQLIYSFGDAAEIPAYVRSAGNVWDSLVCPGIRASDEIRVELENVYTNHVQTAYQYFLENLRYGYEAQQIIDQLSGSLPNSLVAVLILCLGLIALLFTMVLRMIKKPVVNALCFAGLSVCSGIWFFINFQVQCYYVPRPIWNNSLDILSLSLTAMFLMLYFATSLHSRWRMVLAGGAGVWMALVSVSCVTQLAGVADYYDYTGVITVLIAITVVVLLAALVQEWRRHRTGATRMLALSTVVICVGAAADLVCNTLELMAFVLWFKIAFALFILMQFYQLARGIQSIISENAKVQALQVQSENLARILEYQQLITESVRGLYESIYEVDITHNRAGSESTRLYFEAMGVPRTATYDEAIALVARKQIKEEFRKGYVDLFSTAHVKQGFLSGVDSLHYDFQITADGKNYYWMRISARVFYWRDDDSIRMITYRQNIDTEKRREQELFEKLQRDPLTDLYNKAAAETLIRSVLGSFRAVERSHAFIILDIDHFKEINDTLGHVAGDAAICAFADRLRGCFRETDIVGRIGGDEFAVFLQMQDRESLERQIRRLASALRQDIEIAGSQRLLTASIGVAVAPEDGTDFETLYQRADEALYQTKNNRKGGYTLWGSPTADPASLS